MVRTSVFAKRFVIAVLFCVFCPMLTGCSQPEVPGNDAPGSNASNNTPPSDLPEKTPENRGDEALECNWLLKVDQTIPITEDELTINYIYAGADRAEKRRKGCIRQPDFPGRSGSDCLAASEWHGCEDRIEHIEWPLGI